jgi:hypothetical protein
VRTDLLSRKVLFDLIELSFSLDRCEHLTLSPSKIAEVTATRLDRIRLSLAGLPSDRTTPADVLKVLLTERQIVWHRLTLFLRLLPDLCVHIKDPTPYAALRYRPPPHRLCPHRLLPPRLHYDRRRCGCRCV